MLVTVQLSASRLDVTQTCDSAGFWIKAFVECIQCTTTTVLQVSQYSLTINVVVWQFTLVNDSTATYRVANRTTHYVHTDTGRVLCHDVSDIVAECQGRTFITYCEQTARSVTTQCRTHVHIVRGWGRHLLVGEQPVNVLNVLHTLFTWFMLRDGHCHTHIDELGGFVLFTSYPVLQCILATVVVQREMHCIQVEVMINDLFQLLVFRSRIVKLNHDLIFAHLCLQCFNGWNTVVAVDLLTKPNSVQSTSHQEVGVVLTV